MLRWLGGFFLIVVALIAARVLMRHHENGATPHTLAEPVQQSIGNNSIPEIQREGWTLKPLASFSLQARVLGVKKYGKGDTAALSPYDFALGWGPMADESVLKRIEITQEKRFYHWRFWGQPPLPEADIVRYSTNAHMIPVDEAMLKKLSEVKTGDFIQIEGYLVEANHPKADKPWRSSLVRDDRGEGACEIIYTKALQHISGRSGNL